MTYHDLLKRIDPVKNKDKMIIFKEGDGWCNVNINVEDDCIVIRADTSVPFSDEM